MQSSSLDTHITNFRREHFKGILYLGRPSDNSDEEVLLLYESPDLVQISFDHGRSFQNLAIEQRVATICQHKYDETVTYLPTNSTQAFRLSNRGRDVENFALPSEFWNDCFSFQFSPHHSNWVIWHSKPKCSVPHGAEHEYCSSDIFISHDAGNSWALLMQDGTKCQFGTISSPENLIICERLDAQGRLNVFTKQGDAAQFEKMDLQDIVPNVVRISDFFHAVTWSHSTPPVDIYFSRAGGQFEKLLYPQSIHPDPAKLVLSAQASPNGAMFMYIGSNTTSGSEYGTLLKSNEFGTGFVPVLQQINSEEEGRIHLERFKGIESIILANIVTNPLAVNNEHEKKHYKTVISFDDGAHWQQPWLEQTYSNSKRQPVQLHSSKSRRPQFELAQMFAEEWVTFHGVSSVGSIGMGVAYGNSGDSLGSLEEADTFMTVDAGMTWRKIKTGRHRAAWCAQGSVMVLVPDGEPTTDVEYSFDDGYQWLKMHISETPILVEQISSGAGGLTPSILIVGKSSTDDQTGITVNIDFSNMLDERICLGHAANGRKAQGSLLSWMPYNPHRGDSCIMGKSSLYYRILPLPHRCREFTPLRDPHLESTCLCTWMDFECNEGYIAFNETGLCVPENANIDHFSDLDQPNLYEIPVHNPAYRKIPGNHCLLEGVPEANPLSVTNPPTNAIWDSKSFGLLSAAILLAGILIALLWASKFFPHRSVKGSKETLAGLQQRRFGIFATRGQKYNVVPQEEESQTGMSSQSSLPSD